MELRQLRHFLAVAQHGSFRRAADAAEISQPALTKSIRRLEATFGVALFDRHPRGIRLTASGETLVLHAQSVEAELKHTAETMREMRFTARGLLRVGCGPSMGVALLPAVTARLFDCGEAIQVLVRSGLDDTLLAALRAGELDFAVTTMPMRPISGLVAHERLFSDRVVIVGRAGHPLAGRKVELAELRAARWILPNRNVHTRARLFEFLSERGLGQPDVRIETDSVPYLLEVLALTDFLSYAPAQFIARRPLAAIDVADSAWKRMVSVSYWQRRAPTPAGRVFLSVLRDVAHEFHGPRHPPTSGAGGRTARASDLGRDSGPKFA